VAGAHKWLLGPYSFGFCYVDPKWHHGTPLEENWMNRAGSEDFSGLVDYQDLYQSGARRFDMGEASNFILAPIASAALRQILEWGVEDIGETLGAMTARIADLATDLGLHVAPASARSPHMVGVTAPQGLPGALLHELSEQKIFVSVRGNAIRIAPHLYNTEAEVDRLMNALKKALSR
jgi:selenocysteine lyase/cysteine desulfurase